MMALHHGCDQPICNELRVLKTQAALLLNSFVAIARKGDLGV
jgi:hypothetical protein